MIEKCPFCGSEDIYYSKKRKVFVCEDCDETFVEEDERSASAMKADLGTDLELFFSYGHDRNRFLVERIRADLEARGHHVWIDSSEIKTGDHWRKDILDGLMNSAKVIAFLSEHSTRNPGVCLDELKIAVCVKGAAIKTVLLEPESRVKQPSTISEIQWLDMSDWNEIKSSGDVNFEEWYSQKFRELCDAIESVESVELSGDIHLLKDKLQPYLNSEKEYGLLQKNYYGRKWLEDQIENWQDRTQAQALIVYGKPGSGKSAFAVNYSHYNSNVYGCFLCEWNREYTINPKKLVRTMAFKLATKLPDYRSLLMHQLNEDNLYFEDLKAEELFEYLIGYPFSHLVDGNRETGIIVVDGLDEAEDNGTNPLAEMFSRCIERMPKWIKFIFTSRQEKNVSVYFRACRQLDIIDDMPGGYNDIMAFSVKALTEELKAIPNKLEVIDKICELSEGIFLYAELLTEDIKAGKACIQDISAFPIGLNAFYRLSMGRKFKTNESYLQVRPLLELLCISDTVPEELVLTGCQYSKYVFLVCLDKLGAFIERQKEGDVYVLGFSHKSVRDWLENSEQSGEYYVDKKAGAIRLARFCREWLNSQKSGFDEYHRNQMAEYIQTHVGVYYVIAEEYKELESFLISKEDSLMPYWLIWNDFPESWNHSHLLSVFWGASQRNDFVKQMQKEGNAKFLLWIFDKASKTYDVSSFDRELLAAYMDVIHISGDYPKAVEIANVYLKRYTTKEVADDKFLAMLRIRKIHHAMFFKPTEPLLDDAMALYVQLDESYPTVYNELLFLIGGNLGVLNGNWELCDEWLYKSEQCSKKYALDDYHRRNVRKIADCLCQKQDFVSAQNVIHSVISEKDAISNRYDAYLIGALGNIYTCMCLDDEAMQCYGKVLKYTIMKGIVGWAAHANLGIANVNYKMGNIKEAVDFATRANGIYKKMRQEWGIIMSEALLAACESRMGIAPLKVACNAAIKRAQRMHYGSCVSAIEEFCSRKHDYLKLFFL